MDKITYSADSQRAIFVIRDQEMQDTGYRKSSLYPRTAATPPLLALNIMSPQGSIYSLWQMENNQPAELHCPDGTVTTLPVQFWDVENDQIITAIKAHCSIELEKFVIATVIGDDPGNENRFSMLVQEASDIPKMTALREISGALVPNPCKELSSEATAELLSVESSLVTDMDISELNQAIIIAKKDLPDDITNALNEDNFFNALFININEDNNDVKIYCLESNSVATSYTPEAIQNISQQIIEANNVEADLNTNKPKL